MKLINNQESSNFITSDDILMTGQTLGKKLSNVINEHEKDINNLKQYTKWLYAHGGVGSKYGGGGNSSGGSSSSSIEATVKINNTILSTASTQQIILNGDNKITISGGINNGVNSTTYYISIKKNNDYLTKGTTVDKIKYDVISAETWYQFNYDTTITEDTELSIIIVGRGESQQRLTYSANIVKEAYSFNLSFCDNDHNIIVSTDNDLWIDGYASVRETGLNLNINYNVIAENPIKFELTGDNISDMFDCEGNSYISYLNENKERKDSIYIPFKNSFINNNDSIGFYTISAAFEIKEAGQAIQIVYKQISFNLIPQESYFIKVNPYYQNQTFYKYNSALESDIQQKYNDYDLLYQAYTVAYINNGVINNKSQIISYIRNNFNPEISNNINDEDLKNEIYNAMQSFENNIYVYPTGSIAFNLTAYHGTDSGTDISIKGELNGEDVNIGITRIQLRERQKVILNIAEPGVYKFSFYSGEPNSIKIDYYMFVYNKSTEINWYEDTVEIQAQNYWRNSSATYQLKKYARKSILYKFKLFNFS